MTTSTLHRSGCRCSGLDRVCPSRRQAYTLVDQGLADPDPAVRALSEAATAHLVDGHREVERTLAAVVRVSQGATLAEALLASGTMTIEEFHAERKAAIRGRWSEVTGRRVPG